MRVVVTTNQNWSLTLYGLTPVYCHLHTCNIIIHGYQSIYCRKYPLFMRVNCKLLSFKFWWYKTYCKPFLFANLVQSIFFKLMWKIFARFPCIHQIFSSFNVTNVFFQLMSNILQSKPWPMLSQSAPLTSDLCKDISSDHTNLRNQETLQCVLVDHKLPSSRNILSLGNTAPPVAAAHTQHSSLSSER